MDENKKLNPGNISRMLQIGFLVCVALVLLLMMSISDTSKDQLTAGVILIADVAAIVYLIKKIQ